jgi:hypothetical protein
VPDRRAVAPTTACRKSDSRDQSVFKRNDERFASAERGKSDIHKPGFDSIETEL